MIFDFRMSIFDLPERRSTERSLTSGYQNGGNLVCFPEQRLHTRGGQQLCIDNHLRPKAAFIGLLFEDAGFVNEIRARFGSAKRPIICSDRTSASNELIRDG